MLFRAAWSSNVIQSVNFICIFFSEMYRSSMVNNDKLTDKEKADINMQRLKTYKKLLQLLPGRYLTGGSSYCV